MDLGPIIVQNEQESGIVIRVSHLFLLIIQAIHFSARHYFLLQQCPILKQVEKWAGEFVVSAWKVFFDYFFKKAE